MANRSSGLSAEEEQTLAMLERDILMTDDVDERSMDLEKDGAKSLGEPKTFSVDRQSRHVHSFFFFFLIFLETTVRYHDCCCYRDECQSSWCVCFASYRSATGVGTLVMVTS